MLLVPLEPFLQHKDEFSSRPKSERNQEAETSETKWDNLPIGTLHWQETTEDFRLFESFQEECAVLVLCVKMLNRFSRCKETRSMYSKNKLQMHTFYILFHNLYVWKLDYYPHILETNIIWSFQKDDKKSYASNSRAQSLFSFTCDAESKKMERKQTSLIKLAKGFTRIVKGSYMYVCVFTYGQIHTRTFAEMK